MSQKKRIYNFYLLLKQCIFLYRIINIGLQYTCFISYIYHYCILLLLQNETKKNLNKNLNIFSIQLKTYGDALMGLTIKSYEPPNVVISDGLLTINLFVSVNFKVKDTHDGEIKNLFVANFVSFLIFLFSCSLQTHHVYSILIQRGNDRLYVISMWNTCSVF